MGIKLCGCGCGDPTPIAKGTDKRWGHIKGRPIRFINHHHVKLQPIGENAYRWNGGVTSNNQGRILIHNPNHPRAMVRGYVLRYILVAEKALGKPLPKKAVVHHHDEKAYNDKNKNLVICEDNGYHLLLHKRMRAYQSCGNASWLKCSICKKYDYPKNLYTPPRGGSSYHKKCKSEYQKTR